MTDHVQKLLIANRGEIAIRIARAAHELGITTLAVYSEDDATSLHVRRADHALALRGHGPRAYLDAEQLITLALEEGCDAIHPGYGFLSEQAAFAEKCADAGLCFVGPTPDQLALFGDKARARALATQLGVPVVRGTEPLADVAQAHAFFASLGGAPMLLKAVLGGGGRGMRVVRHADELDDALQRCRSEARAAFGDDAIYAEELLPHVRHVEVQVFGDRHGGLVTLGERECSLQRRHQKLVEIAPSPSLSDALRTQLTAASRSMAEHARYQSLGTFEFLVTRDGERFVFIEANPRLQVEHTVTEEVFGVDLVKAQLRVASGAHLDELHLMQDQLSAPRGHAVELRVCLESMDAHEVTPATGTLQRYELPQGPGVRVDATGYVGYEVGSSFDSLIAKVIVHAPSSAFGEAVAKARRALAETVITGVESNLELLQALLRHPAVATGDLYTTFIDEHSSAWVATKTPDRARETTPEGVTLVAAPLQGRIVTVDVRQGSTVQPGHQLAVIEAMKMESAVTATRGGVVIAVKARAGQSVSKGQALLWLDTLGAIEDAALAAHAASDDGIRADLQESIDRHALLLDAARPKAVEKRRKTGQRTARENVGDLCDDGSFVEYGGLAVAAQRRKRSIEELREVSPADGLVSGIGTVNAQHFGAERASTMVIAYDYTVFAGTQGMLNHKKQDRMFAIARDRKLPLVLFAEGGGGRPGDTDIDLRPTLDLHTFRTFAELSGLVPTVGVVSGRCFAGNAVLLGCCDVIIATEDSNIGLAGPVMIEGAGLGAFPPEAIGPIDVQSQNGVVDVRVADEAEAVRVAKQYLAYFQGNLATWTAPDATRLRRAVPENRMRIYEMRDVIAGFSDVDSVLELRKEFGVGMITALVRIEGKPCGVIANEPTHLAGAIDSDAADKAARFMRLCDAFGLPVISIVDTPGFMVGPEAEKTALVRHTTRMLVTAASLRVPLFTVIVRKAYGLGAMAMAGGSLHAPFFTLAWPSGELGAMGLEGAVLLGIRKQLEAITDPEEKKRTVQSVVALLRDQGKAVNVASHIELDDVIDPADTRAHLIRGLQSAKPLDRERKPFIDTW